MGQLAVKVCYTKGADWVDELVEYIYENVKYMSRYVKEKLPKSKDGRTRRDLFGMG